MSRRVTEGEIRLAMLNNLANTPGGTKTTSNLIAELENQFQPQGTDAKTLQKRNDTYFSQKVRNAAGSHVDRPSGLAGQGFVTHDNNSNTLTIEDTGRDYLRSLGFAG